MKKIFAFIVSILPLLAFAEEKKVEVNGIVYIIDGSIASVAESNYSGKIVVPSQIEYDGKKYNVTSVEPYAFYECKDLISVSLPDGITTLGFRGTFTGCENLEEVHLGTGIINIPWEGFMGCKKLKSIIIPEGVEVIGSWAFQNCSALTNVVLPNSLIEIKSRAFGRSGIESITLPEKLAKIEHSIFADCINLEKITLPNKITTITENLFEGCTNLKTIVLSSSVSYIEGKAFKDCSSMKEFVCNPVNAPSAHIEAFENTDLSKVTLKVPTSSLSEYKSKSPWKEFGYILTISGESPTLTKCEKPTINYSNGKLFFNCSTEGVKFIAEITDDDVKTHFGNQINLNATYNIKVYASASGYENSDIVTAKLCWIDSNPQTEGIVSGVRAVNARAVIVQTSGNSIIVNGAETGSQIFVYDISGSLVGSAFANKEYTSIQTTLRQNEIAIVKIGSNSVKILIK